MKLNKKIILMIALLLVLVVIFALVPIFQKNGVKNLYKIFNASIYEVSVQKGVGNDHMKILTQVQEIDYIVSLLQFEQWNRLKNWNKKCSPSNYIIVNKKHLIGFLCKDEKHGYSSLEQEGKLYRFRLPLRVYENIEKYFDNIKIVDKMSEFDADSRVLTTENYTIDINGGGRLTFWRIVLNAVKLSRDMTNESRVVVNLS